MKTSSSCDEKRRLTHVTLVNQAGNWGIYVTSRVSSLIITGDWDVFTGVYILASMDKKHRPSRSIYMQIKQIIEKKERITTWSRFTCIIIWTWCAFHKYDREVLTADCINLLLKKVLIRSRSTVICNIRWYCKYKDLRHKKFLHVLCFVITEVIHWITKVAWKRI